MTCVTGGPLEPARISRTVPAFLADLVECFGDRTAVVDPDHRVTFAELERRSAVWAAALLAKGVGKGDHVGVVLPNGVDWVVAWLAASRIGAVTVAVSTFARGNELLRLLTYSDVKGLIAAPARLRGRYPEMLEAAVPGLSTCSTDVIAVASAPCLRWVLFTHDDGALPVWGRHIDDVAKEGSKISGTVLQAFKRAVHPTDPNLIICTSGTTSAPKCVPHSGGTVVYRAEYLRDIYGFVEGTRTYTSMPLFWVGGLTMSLLPALAAGGTSYWSERFEAPKLIKLVERERIEFLSLFPFQVERMVQSEVFPDSDLSSLVVASPRLMAGREPRTVECHGRNMALGMTETLGPFSWGYLEDALSPDAGIAPVEVLQPGMELRVVDTDLCDVAEGETGEICLRGPTIIRGYYKRDLGAGFDADGWFHTGDLGTARDGRVHFLGRISEIIRTSGAAVSPAEVTEAIVSLDGVEAAYVLPIPDVARGQLVGAAVVRSADATISADEIRKQVSLNISSYKVPAVLELFEAYEIPWTPSNKVRRHELIAMLSERHKQRARIAP